MQTEQNKAIFRQLIEEVFNQGNMSVIDELVAPEFKRMTTADLSASAIKKMGEKFGLEVGAAFYNAGTKYDCLSCETRLVDIERDTRINSMLRGGMYYNLTYGRLYTGFGLPYGGYFRRAIDIKSAVATIYQIGTLKTYVSYSAAMNSFGSRLEGAGN